MFAKSVALEIFKICVGLLVKKKSVHNKKLSKNLFNFKTNLKVA